MTTAGNNKKPQLKNLDDLFDSMETQTAYKHTVVSVAVDSLKSFELNHLLISSENQYSHPFRLYEGERLDDMIESIRKNGVLVPIIVRRKNTALEILAGHNRVNASKLAGLTEIPAIVMDNVSDEDAMVYVIETNLLQRSFTDMTHSEKAAVIALHYSKMFSQGKRNDILEQLKILQNPHEYKENGTSSQVGAKLRTDEKIGETYSLSKNTIARYLRVNKLIQPHKNRLDVGEIAFLSAVILSYLTESEQQIVDDIMRVSGYKADMKKAALLRTASEKKILTREYAEQVLAGLAVNKKNTSKQIPAFKIKSKILSKYFKPGDKPDEIESVISKALELYYSQNTKFINKH